MPSQRDVALSLACLGMVAHPPCVVPIKGRGSLAPSRLQHDDNNTNKNLSRYANEIRRLSKKTAKIKTIQKKEKRKKEKKG